MKSRKTFEKFKPDNINPVFFVEERGQAVLIAVLFFVFISLSMVLAISAPALSHLKTSKSLYASLEAFVVAESGMEDTVYRFMINNEVDATEEVSVGRGVATVTYDETDEIYVESIGLVKDVISRKVAVNLVLGGGVNFAYAVQVGNGGLVLENSSSVSGNVFSNSFVEGSSNNVSGSVIVASSSGHMSGVNVSGSAHSYRIEDSHVGEDAYYMEISNTTVMGDMYPDTEPAEPVDFPITESMMNGWKEVAEEGGVINCTDTYTIQSNQTIGPVRITCNLRIRQNPTITLGGHIWVEGNIEIDNSPTVKVDSSLGDESVVLIADDPSDRINGNMISMGNNPNFQGADGSDRSFIFLISRNEAASEGHSTVAIADGQLATGDVFMYADKGEILIRNNVHVTGLTAYRIRATNNSNITYQEGLADTFFSSGPSAGYVILNWKEIE